MLNFGFNVLIVKKNNLD